MPIQETVFYALSALTLGCALGVIFSKTPIYSILCLILTFFCISGHYVMMNAQFLGVVNIVVYAGAIMVLFLFVVMLMNLNGETEPQKSKVVQVSAVIGGGSLLLILVAVFKQFTNGLTSGAITNPNTEISSILFLSAMIGAIVIGKKDANDVAPSHTL
jgi:NADH-quinone oxidoreductase subunit J